MAYDGTLYASVSGNGFTSSCLEGIPFKISPKFKPPLPTQSLLPSNIGTRTASSALHAEYSFEVEEAVLKWSAEREKQKEEKLELQRQATLRKSRISSSSDNQDDQEADTDTVTAGPEGSQPLYENTKIMKPEDTPRPKPRQKQQTNAYANVTIPNSLIANISNDILQPTLIQSKSKETDQNNEDDKNASSKNDLDLTLFEKQDDPFDNVELKTINDMEELASVLQNRTNITPGRDENGAGAGNQQNNGNNIQAGINTEEDEEGEDQMYENVNLVAIKNGHVEGNVGKVASNSGLLDLSKLPPVPPRRDLVVGSTSPLPPIGQSTDEISNSYVLKSQTSQNTYSSGRGGSPTCPDSTNKDSVVYDNPSTSVSFQPTDSTKPISYNKPPVKKPPRTFKYSRHVEPDQETNVVDRESNGDNVHLQNNPTISTSFSEGKVSVQFTKTQSNPSISESELSEAGLCFDSNHFGDQVNSRPVPAPRKPHSPPSRPSSGQSWNRYSPLPPTPSPSNTGQQPATVALPVISPGAESYSRLRKEAKTSVDNLVGMGFTRDRVIRAVEKLGEDEKEIVEFLCLVDQLTEKGYSVQLAETALLMFRNSMQQASAFLELFTQFQELGFSGEKIKEALVNTNNDREKTLDILTASS